MIRHDCASPRYKIWEKTEENPVLKTCRGSLMVAAKNASRTRRWPGGPSRWRRRSQADQWGVTAGAAVINLAIKDVRKGLDGKMAKFATGTALLRVIKVMAAAGPRCFECLAHKP